METEAGRTRSRKRKLAALDAPAAAEPPNPGAEMKDQELSLPVEDGGEGGAGDLADGVLDAVRDSSSRTKLAAQAATDAPNTEAGMEVEDPPLPGADGGAGDRISHLPDGALEAGRGSSSRTKLAAPAAAEAPNTEAGMEGQDRPLHGADGGAGDRISQLPDGVLGDIISLLPTKEGARTQILASRWRHLWCSAPLNLDYRGLYEDVNDLDVVVSRILFAHPGPGRRFSAPVYHLQAATADAWLRSPALDNLQELELCRSNSRLRLPAPAAAFRSGTLPPAPAAAFRFSETLAVATIGDCHLQDSTSQMFHFPKLKKLGLERVCISESSLHAMITGCLVLECLLIQESSGFRCVRISSISLTSICVKGVGYHSDLRFEELIIENAPCLERLLQLRSRHLNTSVISAPKLETLGRLSYSNRLVFDSTVIQGLSVDTLITSVCTVKILAIRMDYLSLDAVIDLMRCFPSLERLYIESVGPGGKNIWRRKHRDLIRCFDVRLKIIVWRYYRGIKSHVDFATFFLLNAKALELMTLQVSYVDYNENFIAQQRKALQMGSKASRGVQLHIKPPDGYSNHDMIFSVHDLDLADPFERKEYQFHALS